MSQAPIEQIEKARDLIKRARHVAMATVSPDGSPHNTPLAFLYNPSFTKVYWGSHPNSQHSKNIKHEGRVFMVLFDTFQHGMGGLYITANNAHELAGEELKVALEDHNAFRKNWGKEPLELDYYTKDEQRMYSADITKLEVYCVVRDKDGLVKEEARQPITAQDLLVNSRDEL